MSEKLSEEELCRRLGECPRRGQLFTHYKTGAHYRVVGSAIAEATQDALVIYGQAGSPILFARPLREWSEVVEHDGVAGPRFRAVGREG